MSAPSVAESYTGGWATASSSVLNYSLVSNGVTNVLCVAAIAYEPNSSSPINVTSVVDNQGNTWTKYNSNSNTQTPDGTLSNTTQCGVELWYAVGSWAKTGTITVTLSGSADNAGASIIWFNNAYLTHPFDAGAGNPEKFAVATPSADCKVNVSTITADVTVCMVGASASNNNGPSTANINGAPATFGGVSPDFTYGGGDTAGTNWCRVNFVGKKYAAPQTNLACDFGSFTNVVMMGFAITADAQPTPKTFGTMMG